MPSSKNGPTTFRLEPLATRVEFKNDSIIVELSDARTISVPVAWYDGLWEADDKDLVQCEVFGAGTSLFWPTLQQILPVCWIVEGKGYVKPKVDPQEGFGAAVRD